MSRLNTLTAASELRAIIQSTERISVAIERVLHKLCSYFDAYYALHMSYHDGAEGMRCIAVPPASDAALLKDALAAASDEGIAMQMRSYAQPRIINNIIACREFPMIAALSRYHLQHLLIIPLQYQKRTYALILIFRHQNQTVFLERERDYAFGLSLYLGAEWGHDSAAHHAVYASHITADIARRTYTRLPQYRRTQQIAIAKHPIALVGETGVGKTHFAHYLHATTQPRGSQMMTVDCAWLHGRMPSLSPAPLLKSVLVLNVDVLNPEQQQQLMNTLTPLALIIFIEITTSPYFKDIPEAVTRLTKTTIFIDPIRRNPEHTLDFFVHLLNCPDDEQPGNEEARGGEGGDARGEARGEAQGDARGVITPEIERQLRAHRWSGNISELLHVYHRSKGLPDNQHGGLRAVDFLYFEQSPTPRSLKAAMDDYKKKYITSTLMHYHGNQTHAAKVLDIERTYLNKLVNMWYKE